MNEHELSDAMRASRPARPDVRGWADGARRKARNRRFGVVAGAAFAVVAIAVPLAVQYNLEAPAPVVLATPSPTPLTATQLVPDACLDPVTGATPLVDDDLPEGAERIWLCGRPDPEGIHVLVGHPEPLVAGVEEAVAAFNAMETDRGVMDCMHNPLDYTVVAEYADGTHSAARIAGCGDLRDITNMFDVFRGDGAGYLATLQELWAAERADTGFAFSGSEGLCDSNHASVNRPLDVDELSRVVACADLPDGTRRVVNLPDALVDAVLASVRTDVVRWRGGQVCTEPVEGAVCSPRDPFTTPPDLVLMTAEGDPLAAMSDQLQVSLAEDILSDVFVWYDSTQFMVWAMPQDLRADIQDLVDATLVGQETVAPEPTVELPEVPLDGVVREVCSDLPGLDEAIEGPELSTGAARVWLCGYGAVGPIEPLTTDPDRVVEAIQALPEFEEGQVCMLNIGSDYAVVIDYPNGSSRVVRATTGGCQEVKDGVGRVGGYGLLETLKGFWTAQREASPDAFTADVDVCSTVLDVSGTGLSSLLEVERPTFYRGAVCGFPSGGDEGAEPVQRELPPDLVIAISQAQGDGSAPATLYDRLPKVVMFNQYGDPVTYWLSEDLGLFLEDGTWRPDGGLQPLWAEMLDGLQTEPS